MRFFSTRAVLTAAVALFAACDTPSAPDVRPSDGGLSLGKKITCHGNSGGVCDMSVSVLLDGSGRATLVARTGGYDEATGTHEPNGTFEKLQWKVYDGRGRHVSTTNSDASGTVFTTRLAGQLTGAHTVEIQANVRDHEGKKGMAVVRATANPVPAPDLDLSTSPIQRVVGTEREPLSPVAAGSTNTYAVDFVNNASTGIAAKCVVLVGGSSPTTGFAFVRGENLFAGAGQPASCVFTLTRPEGSYPIVVTAVPATGYVDANLLNNFTTGTLVVKKAADLSVVRIDRVIDNGVVSSPVLGSVVAGSNHTFRAVIASPAGSLDAHPQCSVLVDGLAVTPEWVEQNPTITAGSTGTCEFTLPLLTPGTFRLKVIAADAADPNPANDSAEGTIVVTPAAPDGVTTDLKVTTVSPLTPIVGGGPEREYVATVTRGGGNKDEPSFSCVVAVSRRSGTTPAPVVTMVNSTGTANATTGGECRFRVAGMLSNGAQDETYNIEVQVVATNANELTAADNRLVVSQIVEARTVDLVVNSIERDNGTSWVQVGSTVSPRDSVLAGATFTYRAFVGALASAGTNQTGSSFTCRVEVTNLTTSATAVLNNTVAAGLASSTGLGTCTFPLALSASGSTDVRYSIRVIAEPIGAFESPATAGNNALNREQLAMVRADVGVLINPIEMSVDNRLHACTTGDGLCAAGTKSDTIALGKTGVFTAQMRNFSTDRSATVKCEVSGRQGSVVFSVPVTSATPVNIGAGSQVPCSFSFAFTERVVTNFTVVATSTSPLDNARSNDTVRFSITPITNTVFPGLSLSDVTAAERGLEVGGVVAQLFRQEAAISRVVIAFTNKADVIGDFTFTGKVSSNGVQFSTGTFKVTGLTPGGLAGARNCYLGSTTSSALNSQFVQMEICAEQSPTDANVQQISVGYNSQILVNPLVGESLFNFGPDMTFDLKLEWLLTNGDPRFLDTASGRLKFNVAKQTSPDGSYTKNQTGTVVVLPPL